MTTDKRCGDCGQPLMPDHSVCFSDECMRGRAELAENAANARRALAAAAEHAYISTGRRLIVRTAPVPLSSRVRCDSCGLYQDRPSGGGCVQCGSVALQWARRSSDRAAAEVEQFAKLDMVTRALVRAGVTLPRILERVRRSFDEATSGEDPS